MKFMSDERQETLIKSAECVLDMMKLSVHPDAALKKVAQDEKLNAKEIELVSSAVNNSQTLAVLQTRPEGEKHKDFPITNAKTVVHDLFPDAKEEISQSAKDRRLDKKAVDQSYFDYNDYKFDADLAVRDFRFSATIEKTASAEKTAAPDFDGMEMLVREARIGFTAARDAADVALAKVANAFRATDAPQFSRFEKIARTAGVTEELLDMVYVLGNLEKIGHSRSMEKTAGTIRALPAEYQILKDIVHADTMWKQAADYLAAAQLAQEDLDAAEASWGIKKKAAESPMSFTSEVSPKMDSGHFDKLIESGLGGADIHSSVLDIAGIRKGDTSGKAPESVLHTSERQQLKNFDARTALEGLMSDPYVGKHSLPEVIEAYNRAMSVNPRFGQAELASYIRNDLASEGGVPLDLQIRASKSHTEDKTEQA